MDNLDMFQEFSGSFTVPIIEDNLSDFLASLTVPNVSERQVREFALKFEHTFTAYRHEYVWQYRKDKKGHRKRERRRPRKRTVFFPRVRFA